MQELLGRIARLDPSASLALRVIACFDELIVGNVNTRALLSAAASLAGCTAGYQQIDPPRILRMTRHGETDHSAVPDLDPQTMSAQTDGIVVWLERGQPPLPNDLIILERLELAIRIRHGKGNREIDNRRNLGVLTSRESTSEDRLLAAGELGLMKSHRYRVIAAPLFAVWATRPSGPEDVISTRFGPIHAILAPEGHEAFEASPCGLGVAAPVTGLDRSLRTALVALRLCEPPHEPLVRADSYGGLVELLAEAGEESQQGDAERLESIAQCSWGLETLGALVATQSVREAARQLTIHHSTLQTRVDSITETLGFNPLEGFGRTRLGTAYLIHRLRHSTVLDLPAP